MTQRRETGQWEFWVIAAVLILGALGAWWELERVKRAEESKGAYEYLKARNRPGEDRR